MINIHLDDNEAGTDLAQFFAQMTHELADAMAQTVAGARCTECGRTWQYRPSIRTEAGTMVHTTKSGTTHGAVVVDADVPATVSGAVTDLATGKWVGTWEIVR